MRWLLVPIIALSTLQASAQSVEVTYSVMLTSKQLLVIGALLDAAPCPISSIVAGTCDALLTFQAINAQILEQNKARAAAAAPK